MNPEMHYLAKLLGASFSDYKSNNTTRVFIDSIKIETNLLDIYVNIPYIQVRMLLLPVLKRYISD